MAEHSGDTYADKAAKYAATIDTKPMTVHYERPGLMSLLPELDGLRVLDVGCGTGWYAEYLLEQGCTVTSFDFNEDFVAMTRDRVGDRATVLHANLAEPLTFSQADVCDLVLAPLVMHYVRDWGAVFAEFRRVLRPGGLVVFSTHHPFTDVELSTTGEYFGVELVEDEWDVGTVHFYRRPLTAMCADLAAAGFVIERLLEPLPEPEFKATRPDMFDRLHRHPLRLMFRARAEV
jgi:SAM-dependent methyltransferase